MALPPCLEIVTDCIQWAMKPEPEKLLEKHNQLVHSDMLKVTSHVQRNDGDWILNTIMVEGYDVPFRYKRKQ